MEYEIVKLEENRVKGIGIRTTNENGQSIKEIGQTWQQLFSEGIYQQIQNKVNYKTIGLYTDYEGDYTKPYQFIAGVEVNEEEEQITKVIPEGIYAKFVIQGDMQRVVGEAWSKIWTMNLKRKYSCDFEEYQNNGEDMQNQEIHIYIALEE